MAKLMKIQPDKTAVAKPGKQYIKKEVEMRLSESNQKKKNAQLADYNKKEKAKNKGTSYNSTGGVER